MPLSIFETRKDALADAQYMADFHATPWFIHRIEPGPIWLASAHKDQKPASKTFEVTKTTEVEPV